MSVPFAGELFTFEEPDGSQVRLLGWGNQFEAVFETLDGYTVVNDPVTGFHHYARLSDDGTTLLPLGPRVGTAQPESLGIPQHLRTRRPAARERAAAAHDASPVERRWEQRRRERRSAIESAAEGLAAPPQPTAAGDVTGLCILVQFPDVPGTITRQQVDNFCNQVGYSGFGNNGSVRDYFLEISEGKLRYRNVVTAYYTAQQNRAYYTNPAIPFGSRARELITEALTNLRNNGFDFSQLSADSGGFVYALNVFYAGERVNSWSQGLWPHQWVLSPDFVASPTRTFRDYQITNMGAQLTLRTFCHENGHMVCDFPDLYDYGSESHGVGHYCLMCYGGADTNPVHVSAYLKNEAGWTSKLTTLSAGSSFPVSTGTNDFLLHAKNSTEYFIIENRRQTGRDAALPDAGLLIWHVDENGSNNNEQMTPAQHYELSLVQADNRADLEHAANQGDSSDLYGSPANQAFGDATSPNSKWWDGTASGLDIVAVSAPGAVVTVKTNGAGPTLVVANFGYNAGSWRVSQHPRFAADTTGDGRADIVGFGNAGVYVSKAQADGSYGPVQLLVNNFGFNAGSWRVDEHPRFLADTTGDGRADIVGLGNAGVYVSKAQANGSYGPVQLLVNNFGFNAGSWHVDQHPRFLADTTGDRRADIVGFGDAGVYVSRAPANGSYGPVQLVVNNFGFNAGSWRVDQHPRFLADTTGDGRADLVGFGNAGVYVSRAQPDGSYGPVQLVVSNFGFNAGSWRVGQHPRFLADTTGDGRADIVGFGNAGVYVSKAQADGSYGPVQLVVENFGFNAGGWRVGQHPRFLADTSGDGRADIVGFGNAGVYVSRAQANGTFGPVELLVTNFGYDAGGWRVPQHPRLLADTTGGGRQDVIGFGNAGVWRYRW